MNVETAKLKVKSKVEEKKVESRLVQLSPRRKKKKFFFFKGKFKVQQGMYFFQEKKSKFK